MTRLILKRITLSVLVLCTCVNGFSQTTCYPDAPNAIACYAEKVASDIVAHKADPKAPERVEGVLANLMLYTIADASVGLGSIGPLCTLEDFQHLGETARTDKQMGSSPKSEGSTTLVEKPGFAQLLGFAVEHGAIKQSVDGTTLTLSTTPYSLIALANGSDTAQLYQDAAFFNRFGISASFKISNTELVLANATRNQLSEWSARARLTGDRSSRSRAFGRFWREQIAPVLQQRLNLLTGAFDAVITSDATFNPIYIRILRGSNVADPNDPGALKNRIAAYLQSHLSSPDAESVAGIKEIIMCALRSNVYDPIKRTPGMVSDTMRAKLQFEIIPGLARSQGDIAAAAKLLEQFIKEFTGRPAATFQYTNHRVTEGSDFSVLKLIYSSDVAPLKVTANAGLSLYSNPDRMMNQQRLRDYNFALSLEGEARNPFAEAADLSKITYAFSGSYQRMKEFEGVEGKKADIASAQFRVEFPIAKGFSIPIAYTYSSATEMGAKKENKFNFGLQLDFDKLYALTRLSR